MSPSARAAAVVPRLPDGRVLVGARTRHARSWPGTIAFPGGACEDIDDRLPLLSGRDRVRAGALRELGEEVGLWCIAKSDRSPVDDATRASFEAAMAQGTTGGLALAAALAEHGLVLDDQKLTPLLLWKTWDGRFTVQQFLLPLDDVPARSPVAVEELNDLAFVSPARLRADWRDGRAFLIAPIRRVIVELARVDAAHGGAAPTRAVIEALRVQPNATERAKNDLVEGICVLSARSPTLPPATHTNAVLLGAGAALLVDPATPWPEEQDRFDRQLAACLGNHKLRAIVCTHHHVDHVGDVARLAHKHAVPIWAHAETAKLVDFPIARTLVDGDVLACPGEPARTFRVVFTPGHAPGHICLLEESTRLLVAGDMVAGVGSILIDPPEGHMGTYLASLARLRDLEPRGLIPSHGPLLVDGKARLEEQLAHRAMRQAAVLASVQAQDGVTIEGVVKDVYGKDTPAAMLAFAARSVLAALELCRERDEANERDGLWRATRR